MSTSSAVHQVQITKKLAPDQAGAKKLVQRYCEILARLRYRQDAPAGQRCNTVEPALDVRQIAGDNRLPDTFQFRIANDEVELQRQI